MARDVTALPDQLAVRPYGRRADVLREALEGVLNGNSGVDGLEVRSSLGPGAERTLVVNARRIPWGSEGDFRILMSLEDTGRVGGD